MGQRRPLGDMLQELGRVSQSDVDRALEHQRQYGGRFGEALVALGVLGQEEVNWTLASQFDLPYVFPHPDSVDPDAAALVSASWALTYRALPITRIDDRVTLVVDSPLNKAAAEDLARRAGVQVELALASTASIRDAIREVYSRERRRREGLTTGEALTFGDFRRHVEAAGAMRWGISVRDRRAIGWFEQAGVPRRYRLRDEWETELNAAISPPPTERLARRGESSWEGSFNDGTDSTPLMVKGLATAEGREIVVAVRDTKPGAGPPKLPQGMLDELRLLLDAPAARIAVRSEPPDVARRFLPHLPELLLSAGHRSIHITTEGGTPALGGVFEVVLQGPPESYAQRIRDLADFHFDAATAELGLESPKLWAELINLAPLVFMLLAEDSADSVSAVPAAAEWLLSVMARGDGPWHWTLEPAAER